MHSRTKRALAALSLPSDLIERIDANGDNLSTLKASSAAQLQRRYSAADIGLFAAKLHRQEIEEEVIESILRSSGGACAYCADGNASRPYQIHHISPYAHSQDNSEDNLLLVCPTHHATIHAAGVAHDAQKAVRSVWYAVRGIADDYARRGVSFAYGSYEAVAFASTNNAIAELLGASPSITPAAARELAASTIAESVLRRLAMQRFVLLSGAPGSGKSTLALGVAGRLADEGRLILRYRRAFQGENRAAVSEILQLLTCVSRPCLLLLEDVNLWLTESDVETIAAASTAKASVLATATSEDATGRLEIHLRERLCTISWDAIRPEVAAFISAHEAEAARLLQAIRPPDWIERVGLDSLSTSVSALVRRYSESAQSVWQFMFLLRGGWATVEQELGFLVDQNRADMPLLYAAVEQIAGVERAVTPSEVTTVLKSMQDPACCHVSEAWVTKSFESLWDRRLVVRRRDGFSPTHRDWARAYISAALNNPRTASLTRELLLRDFDVRNAVPRRMMILWSWFYYDTAGAGAFAGEWAKKQSDDDWRVLVGRGAAASITDLGIIAHRLHLLFSGPAWKSVLAAAFVANEGAVEKQIVGSTAQDWHSIHQVFAVVEQVAPDMVRRLLMAWTADEVASLIDQARPHAFNDIEWFLGIAVRQLPEWVERVGQRVSWDAISSNLDHIPTGKVDDVERCARVIDKLGIPLTRSRLKRLVDVKRDTLAAAELGDIDFDLDIYLPLEVLPAEARRVADGLDVNALAEQFMAAGPQHWGRLAMLSVYIRRASGYFAERLVDKLDVTRLGRRVREEGHFYPTGVGHLLWQLALGKRDRGPEIAEQLYPVLLDLLATAGPPTEVQNAVIKALAELDRACAIKLATSLGLASPLPESTEPPRRTIFEQLPDAQPLLERVAELEKSGEDYDVDALLREHIDL